MLAIAFGYPACFKSPYLSSYTCHYSPHELRTRSIDVDKTKIEAFIKDMDTYQYHGFAWNIRVPSLDNPETRNGVSYTCIGLIYTELQTEKELAWTQFNYALESLQTIATLIPEIPEETITYIEREIWKSIQGTWLHFEILRKTKRLLWHFPLTIAEKFYNPEYLWKTGKNKGKKTMEVLVEKHKQDFAS